MDYNTVSTGSDREMQKKRFITGSKDAPKS
jgi:hypothetical protein